MTNEDLINNIIYSRYGRDALGNLNTYIEAEGYTNESVSNLLESIIKAVKNPINWENYTIPEVIKENQKFFANLIIETINELNSEELIQKKDLVEFIDDSNPFIKYSTNRWFMVNPSNALEIYKINTDIQPQKLIKSLSKFNLNIGDEVIHLHIIGKSEKDLMIKNNYNVDSFHWTEEYYRQTLTTVSEVLKSNPKCKGLFCEASWVFAPNNFSIYPDNKPAVGFDFLNAPKYYGERFFVEKADQNGIHPKQLEFATRNLRRKKLYNEGSFTPEVWGIYYNREELVSNF